ncbi:MAG: apolipoprotein N-acyltransferase [Pseudomonadota bacterium]
MTTKKRQPAKTSSKAKKDAPKAPRPPPSARLRRLAPWLGAVLSGALIFLSFPAPDLGYPIWIALIPLLLVSSDATPGRGFALGMVTGWLANVVGFFWMEHMLVTFGPPWMAGPVAWIIVALGALYQALPYGGALALARLAGVRGHGWAAVTFLAAFTGLEAFHPILFPWYIGDSMHGVPLPIQVADLVGVYGVTFLIVAVNLSLWTLAERFLRRRSVPLWPAWAGGVLLIASLGYGAVRIAQVDAAAADLEHLRIGVVEPEIPIFQEQRALYPEGTSPVRILHHNLQRLHRATLDLASRGVDLVLWPESAWFPVLSVAARDAPFEHLALADGQVHARDGGPWTWVEALAGTRWVALSGGREDRVMAGGEGGAVARWREGAWAVERLPTQATVTAVHALCDEETEWAGTKFAPCWYLAGTGDGALWLDGGDGWGQVDAVTSFVPEVLGGVFGSHLTAAGAGEAIKVDEDGGHPLDGAAAAAAGRRGDRALDVPPDGPGAADAVVVGWTSQPYWISRKVRRFYQALSRPPPGDYPAALDADIEEFSLQERNAPQRGTTVPMLVGAVTGDHVDMDHPSALANTKYNSAILVDRDGRVAGIYDKQFLLMFGEYIPFGDRFEVLYDWIPEAGRFTPGDDPEPLTWEGHRLGVLICYEDILPEYTRKAASRGVDILLNLTNDAWFGKTAEPAQHFALATLRAVEHRRWLVRATATGISGAVDPVGREVVRTGLYEAETFVVEVTLGGGGTVYQTVGPLLPALCLLLAALLAGFALRDRRRKTT